MTDYLKTNLILDPNREDNQLYVIGLMNKDGELIDKNELPKVVSENGSGSIYHMDQKSSKKSQSRKSGHLQLPAINVEHKHFTETKPDNSLPSQLLPTPRCNANIVLQEF